MSFDPTSGPPQRPRSTPIPDPDHPGQALPPPTPAQFLEQQSSLPWTPKPGVDVNAPFAASSVPPGIDFGGPVQRTGGGRTLLVIVLLLAGLGVAAAILVARRVETSQADPAFPVVTEVFGDTPRVTSVATAPTITEVPTLAETTLVETPLAETPIAETPLAETTLPTPPPATEPPPAPTLFPGGVASLFEGGATRAVTDQLDLALAGEPTQFTQVILFADQAIATAQDPAQTDQLIGAFWRDGAIGDASITSSGGGELSYQLFAGGEVNWEAIAGLVAGAPAQLNIADGHVTYVVVQRVGQGNPPPLVIDVYVEGASGKGFVEAAADGRVIGLH